MNGLVAYWLVPCTEQLKLLQPVVHDLALRFDGPMFEPHVTVFYGRCGQPVDHVAVADRLAAGQGPISLKAAGTGFVPGCFQKTFYLKFHPNPRLVRLSSEIDAALAAVTPYRIDPHMSLLYASIAAAEQSRLAEEIQSPLGEVIFDDLRVIDNPALVATKADVEAWREICRRKLA